MSHGGARAGAGRPTVALVDLVLAGRFDAANRRHREKLMVDDSLRELKVARSDPRAERLAELRELQRRFRQHSGVGPAALGLAKLFQLCAARLGDGPLGPLARSRVEAMTPLR